jgi:hypothetical protein
MYFRLNKKSKLKYCSRWTVINSVKNLILSSCVILLFLLRSKYNVFRFENLHNDRVQHCLHHRIFSYFFKIFVFEFCKLQRIFLKGSMVPELHLEFLYTLKQTKQNSSPNPSCQHKISWLPCVEARLSLKSIPDPGLKPLKMEPFLFDQKA